MEIYFKTLWTLHRNPLLRFCDLSIAWYSFSNVCGSLAAHSLRHICSRARGGCEIAKRFRHYFHWKHIWTPVKTHRRYNCSCFGRHHRLGRRIARRCIRSRRSRTYTQAETLFNEIRIVAAVGNRWMGISIEPFVRAVYGVWKYKEFLPVYFRFEVYSS